MQLEKFIQLRQGDSTIKKYIAKFTELAKFGMSLIDTPMKKAIMFVKGLNSPLREMSLTEVPIGATYEMLVETALLHVTNEKDRGTKKEKPTPI